MGTNLTEGEQAKWQAIKAARDTIRAWAQEMYDIDGDYAQVGEILDEWFGDLRPQWSLTERIRGFVWNLLYRR